MSPGTLSVYSDIKFKNKGFTGNFFLFLPLTSSNDIRGKYITANPLRIFACLLEKKKKSQG